MSNLLGLDEPKSTSGEYDNVATEPDPELIARAKSGANWFYWIAGLSLINSIAFIAGANFQFLAGLGVNAIVDAVVAASIEQGAPSALRVVAIVINLIVVISFALAGYFAGRLFQIAFIAGIVVYVFDTLIVLLLQEFLMAGFHAFALFFIIRGFLACRAFKAQLRSNIQFQVPPPPPVT